LYMLRPCQMDAGEGSTKIIRYALLQLYYFG
jgi:hypothetical protein